jgi:hypothetical protein
MRLSEEERQKERKNERKEGRFWSGRKYMSEE